MISRTKLVVGTALSLALCGSLVTQAQKPSTSRQDEAAIRQVVQRIEEGWNAHDGKAFAAPFAANADYVIVNGMHVKGKQAIAGGHTAIFTSIYKDSHNVGTVKSVRFLRPDVAIAHVEWNLVITPGGDKNPAMNTMVLTKDNGKWSIAVFQNTPVQQRP